MTVSAFALPTPVTVLHASTSCTCHGRETIDRTLDDPKSHTWYGSASLRLRLFHALGKFFGLGAY
jgi:hypothetical protein